MYALRRTVAAFLLGATLFGAPVVMAATVTYGNDLGSGLDFHDDGQVELISAVGGSVKLYADGSADIQAAGGGAVHLGTDGSATLSGGALLLQLIDGNLLVTGNGLPTSDPHVQGALYVTTNGTVKVSAG